ncbi:MAG: hypothetical protein AABY89_12640 [Acidobacteriota bacterium]
MTRCQAQDGTTLIEAMIAIGLLATAAVSLAALTSIAIRSSTSARDRSVSTVLALQKMEQLTRRPAALAASPFDAVWRDVAGFFEYVDAAGRATTLPPAGGRRVYVRRWAVVPFPLDANLLALSVSVGCCRHDGGSGDSCHDPATMATLATIRSRTAW